ncbi:MAG: hypothetical protein M3P45_00640 [Acidobacteriota bacterium]|nr:hypothetical protein [Acidobacteriota bacterium]
MSFHLLKITSRALRRREVLRHIARMHRAKIHRIAAVAMILLAAVASIAPSARAERPTSESPDIRKAFDRYIQAREARARQELADQKTFLWIDTQPPRDRERSYSALKHGQIIVQPSQGCSPQDCGDPPGGLVHDWTAVVFIPGVTLAQTLATLQNYDRDSEYYSPQVARSRLLSRDGDNFRVFLRLKQTRLITVVLDTEYEIHYTAVDGTHAVSTSRSTRVAEIEDAGTPQERVVSSADEHGFLWRLNSYWRFYQADGGIYIQCNAISLTRDVPAALGWMIGRFIENISRESLIFTLTATRQAVLNESAGAARNKSPNTRSRR